VRASGSKVITDPGELGPDLLEALGEALCRLGHVAIVPPANDRSSRWVLPFIAVLLYSEIEISMSEPTPDKSIERLRQRLARVGDQGWFFAQIAEQVAERRRELGLSQQQLAELTGTTQSAIARLESGGRPPRIDTLLRITNALDCELEVQLRPRTTKGDTL
jgi:DNA-binding XRE family transcriptional regulator